MKIPLVNLKRQDEEIFQEIMFQVRKVVERVQKNIYKTSLRDKAIEFVFLSRWTRMARLGKGVK